MLRLFRMKGNRMRILGLDPSLSSTGWGVIEVVNNRLRYVADGFIKTNPKDPLPERLALIHRALNDVISLYKPCLLYTSPSPRDP